MGNSEPKKRFITYLLGAGASANALPVVKIIPERLSQFRDDVKKYLNPKKEIITQRDIDKKPHQIITDIDWLLEQTKKHMSIDTFAKKLWTRGNREELMKLKKLLSYFFIFEQVDKLDMRYDNFIASIIDSTKKPSNDVRILNWNYDYQFEKAYSEYQGYSDLDIIQEKLNVAPSPNKTNPDSTQGFLDKLCLVKLNGTTSFKTMEGEILNLIKDLKKRKDEIEFKKIFESHYNTPDSHSLVTFAWEKNQLPSHQKVQFILNHTVAMVIIGYSFPQFNREVDKQIFNQLQGTGKKIYIQDLNTDTIKVKLKGVMKTNDYWDIIPVNMTDQFFIPFELEIK